MLNLFWTEKMRIELNSPSRAEISSSPPTIQDQLIQLLPQQVQVRIGERRVQRGNEIRVRTRLRHRIRQRTVRTTRYPPDWS